MGDPARLQAARLSGDADQHDERAQRLIPGQPLTEHEVESGYTEWAPRYDGPNPAIAAEQPIVHRMLEAVAPGVALDAACGTGRHAAKLAELGHRVIGVDTTNAMLDVAREKVPEAEFRVGRLEALPVDDASVDVLTCTLALTHVEQLGPLEDLRRVSARLFSGELLVSVVGDPVGL